MIVAYLRVSTGHQVLDNQKNEIEKFAAAHGMHIDRWVTEIVSGKKQGCDRKLGALMHSMHSGDTLIVTELSRLSRTLMDIMAIVSDLIKKNVRLYSIKENCAVDDSINSKVLLFAFGLVAEIERNLISMRTREALSLRRQMGVSLGRPKGSCPKMSVMLSQRAEIEAALGNGTSVASICRHYKISRTTFIRFRKICVELSL